MNALSRISPREREYEQARQNFDNILGYLDGNEAFTMSHTASLNVNLKKGP